MKIKDLLSENIKIGTTIEVGDVRVHRYSGSIVVTDLSNAGKRGKKVREFSLYDIDDYRVKKYTGDEGALSFLEEVLVSKKSYDEKLKAAHAFVEMTDDRYSVTEKERKGVDVEQGKTAINNGKIDVTYSTTGFSITDLSDKINVPRAIPPANSGKTDIAKFYKLMSNELNRKRIEKMNYRELLQFMTRNGIYYHEYMGMD